LRNEQSELLQLSKDMEKRINDLEKKEIDLNKQIQRHIDIVNIYYTIFKLFFRITIKNVILICTFFCIFIQAEEAKLNCDRALLKEDHYVKEIQRLKNSLTENTSKFNEKSEKNISLYVY